MICPEGQARTWPVTKIAAAHLISLIQPEDTANVAVLLALEEARMVTRQV
jgi:hypothetical protein